MVENLDYQLKKTMKKFAKLLAEGNFDQIIRTDFTVCDVENCILNSEEEIEIAQDFIDGINKINSAIEKRIAKMQSQIDVDRAIIENGNKLLEMIEKDQIMRQMYFEESE